MPTDENEPFDYAKAMKIEEACQDWDDEISREITQLHKQIDQARQDRKSWLVDELWDKIHEVRSLSYSRAEESELGREMLKRARTTRKQLDDFYASLPQEDKEP